MGLSIAAAFTAAFVLNVAEVTGESNMTTRRLPWTNALQEAYQFIKTYGINPYDVVRELYKKDMDPEHVYKALVLIRRMDSSTETLNALWVMKMKPAVLYRVLREIEIGPQLAYYALKLWWERPDMLKGYNKYGYDENDSSVDRNGTYVDQLLKDHFASIETMDYWKGFHYLAYRELMKVYPTAKLKTFDPELYERYKKRDRKVIDQLLELNNITINSSELEPISEPLQYSISSPESESSSSESKKKGKKAKKKKEKKEKIRKRTRKPKKEKKEKKEKKGQKGKRVRKGKKGKAIQDPMKDKKSKKYQRKKPLGKGKPQKKKSKKRKGRRKRDAFGGQPIVHTVRLRSEQLYAWTDTPDSVNSAAKYNPDDFPDDSESYTDYETTTQKSEKVYTTTISKRKRRTRYKFVHITSRADREKFVEMQRVKLTIAARKQYQVERLRKDYRKYLTQQELNERLRLYNEFKEKVLGRTSEIEDYSKVNRSFYGSLY